MPTFEMTVHAQAPVEEVWKLLHDPRRFPEWWVGVETVEPGGPDDYTMWPTGYPDFPMPQQLRCDRVDGRVSISCLVSDLQFVWRLRAAGEATDVEVQVTIPEAEAHRLTTQQAVIGDSLSRLALLAARSVVSWPTRRRRR